MKRRRTNLISSINVVPYLDVMLVLLVIFMITAPLLNQGVIDLPSVGEKALSEGQGDALLINYHNSKNYSLNNDEDNRQTLDEVMEKISHELLLDPKRPVVLAVDGELSHKDAMKFYGQVIDALEEKEIKHEGRIGFAATAEK